MFRMRGPSLVELTGHDNGVAAIVVHINICILYRFGVDLYRISSIISPGGFNKVDGAALDA